MGYKILLADDSVTVQKIITLTFSDEGVDVLTVNNGDEAVNRLQYMRPALVMADVSIPGKNGYEICEFVKQHPEMKNTPVILLVPAFEPFDEERARRIGADHYLTKPFQSIRTLISTVKSLIDPDEKRRGAPVIAEVKAKPETDPSQRADSPINGAIAVADSPVIRFSAADVLLDVDSDDDEAATSEAGDRHFNSSLPSLMDHSSGGNVLPFGRNSPDDSDDSDHVLDLDDVLWTAPVAQTAVVAKPSLSSVSSVGVSADGIDEETGIEAPSHFAPGSSVPQSAIDEIVDEIVERVVARLTEKLTETLAERLGRDLAKRLAHEVAEIIKQQQLAEKAAYREPDALLELDEV